jgi:hypothetical protein
MRLSSACQMRLCRRVINALIKIAEREDGIERITFCVGRTSWHDSVANGYLWYNILAYSRERRCYYETTRCVKV